MLRRRMIVAALGSVTRMFSLAFMLPILIAILYDPFDTSILGYMIPRTVLIFTACSGLSYLLGLGLERLSGVDEVDLHEREAYLTVGIGWLMFVLLSSLPFILTGELGVIDAWFEAMSGLTTTGATVMAQELESVSKALMIWRALLQYLGGLGIIVLGIALLAKLTHGGMQMLQAEAPGPTVSRATPRLMQTARIMWGLYLGMAAAFFVLMMVLLSRHGLPFKEMFYEALLHTFTTIATGGFSNHHASIAYFDDPLIEGLIIVFILAAGTNFVLLHAFLKGNWRALVKDAEWRFYMANFVVVTLLVTGILWHAGLAVMDGFREAVFTIAAMMTSTGFAATDYDAWPDSARVIVLFVMVAGGSAGSTSGGLKMVRILLLFKIVAREIRRIQHPQAIVPIRIAGRPVQPATVMTVVGFFFAYVAVWAVGTILLVSLDPSMSNMVDAASASLSAISNMGPALGVVGPNETYAGLTDVSKIILSFEMWIGRLEIFTALLVFMPATWRN